MLNYTKNDSVRGSVSALGKGAPGQWRIQGAQGDMPPQTMDKFFSHLVIQITDGFLNNETHKNCLNRYFNN